MSFEFVGHKQWIAPSENNKNLESPCPLHTSYFYHCHNHLVALSLSPGVCFRKCFLSNQTMQWHTYAMWTIISLPVLITENRCYMPTEPSPVKFFNHRVKIPVAYFVLLIQARKSFSGFDHLYLLGGRGWEWARSGC